MNRYGCCLPLLVTLVLATIKIDHIYCFTVNTQTNILQSKQSSKINSLNHHHHTNVGYIRKSDSKLFFFGRGNNNDNKKDIIDKKDDDTTKDNDKNNNENMSIFSRISKVLGNTDSITNNNNNEIKTEEIKSNVAVITEKEDESKSTITPPTPITIVNPIIKEVLTPIEYAKKLRADAEIARLEADRLDAELTLRKITKIERELINITKNPEKINNIELKEQLQREMNILQSKLRGEKLPSIINPIITKTTTTSSSSSSTSSSINNDNQSTDTIMTSSLKEEEKVDTRTGPFYEGKLSTIIEPFDQEEFDKLLSRTKNVPNFIKKALALSVELDFNIVDDINITELAIRVDKMNRLDYSFSKRNKPKFTLNEINERKNELIDAEKTGLGNWLQGEIFPPALKDARSIGIAKDNETEFALMLLEYEYYFTENDTTNLMSINQLEKIADGEEWMKPVLKALNSSVIDNTIDTLYPKCTRKEGNEPTLKQIQLLISDILPKVSFQSISKPEEVLGGYIIRGTTKLNGDELIEKIDTLISKSSSLSEKLTVLYTNDFTVFAENPDDIDINDLNPILYITGYDIVRDSKPVQLSIVSGLGIATSWYLALFPFMLNPTIAARVDEQVALSEAGMNTDLAWLTDLSIPLFATFIGIQLIHELGHLVAAGANNMKIGPPTFVPSIITGITSSVTTFREPPKNKAAMFDFSISGPLAGMLASLAAITLGAQLTILSDTSYFPALPLEILRQSTLGGGIINAILGNGALSVPEGALGTPAVAAMTVPLHPIAIAGYISLIVNALSLLPVGTTDGGRIGLALFGRAAKPLIGNVFLFALLFTGLVGSDLFLFYFAFIIGFQSGNELPARNEVDKLDLTRAGFATVVYFIAILSLVPFQL